MSFSRIRQVVFALCVCAVASCAGNTPAAPKDQRAATDPWEPLNRRLYNFNQGFDSVTFKPLAKGYAVVVPGFMQQGVNNFSRNLRGPLHIINNLLQGKVERGVIEFGRLLTNTVFGIGGLFDFATSSGLESFPETFPETLAVWGVPDGPYVVIPVLGSQTLSGAFTIPLTFLVDPLFYVDDDAVRWSVYGIRLVDVRMRLFALDELTEDSFDRYLTVRESFLQNRRFRIYDGDPPEDEEFYDDFLEEEEQQP